MNQKVFTGGKHLESLGEYLHSQDVERVLLITGKSSYADSTAKSVLEPQLNDFQITRFNEFTQNPKFEHVKQGIQIFKKYECQAIIAVGGGSVLDMGKLIKAYNDSALDMSAKIINNEVGMCLVPLVAIPTTAGSGSEATEFAVVYVDGSKYSVANKKLRPDLVFLIPEFTLSASPYLTASTGLDALTQSIESFWSVNSTVISRTYSKEALELIWRYLPLAVHMNDKAARIALMKAAHLAGKAINIAKTTAAHALSYSFTSHHGIPHGHAVALTIAYFCAYNSQLSEQDCNDERGASHVRGIFAEMQEIIGESDLEKALTTFIGDLGLALSIPESSHGVKKDIDRILGNINAQRMKNNPRAVQNDDLRTLLQKIILKN